MYGKCYVIYHRFFSVGLGPMNFEDYENAILKRCQLACRLLHNRNHPQYSILKIIIIKYV